jgi:hypothetical protein
MDEGTESLVLGGGGQVALCREMIEESGDVGAAERPRPYSGRTGFGRAAPGGLKAFVRDKGAWGG